MKIKKISILNEFTCVAGNCPVSCCRGWKVPIDDKTYLKYLEQKGLFGFNLRLSIEKKDGIVAFKNIVKGCPFWEKDRLCGLQKKYGHEYMPQVCIQFPRQLYNFEFFCEETLYLACPEAAGIFLSHIGDENPVLFSETDGVVDYPVSTTNDDGDFLEYLVNARDNLIKILELGCQYNSEALYDYALSAQNAVLSQDRLPLPEEFWSNNNTTPVRAFTCKDMNRLMYDGFYHPNLKKYLPFLYSLCKKYFITLGYLCNFNSNLAEKKLNKLISDLYKKTDSLPNLLKRYYEYFLMTDFLDTFEDYSFSKHISFGIAKTNMLLVFLAVYAGNKASVSNDEIAKIIAVFERRSPQIKC